MISHRKGREQKSHALFGHHVAYRIGLFRDKTLQEMAEGVNSRRGSEFWWKTDRELGIQDYTIGNKIGTHDADLELFLGKEHDGVGRRLRAGTCSSRYHDSRYSPSKHAPLSQFGCAPFFPSEHCKNLGRIHNRTAPNGYNYRRFLSP